MHLKEKSQSPFRNSERKLEIAWKPMPLKSYSVSIRNPPVFEVCDPRYGCVLTAIDLYICNVSVLSHYHLEGSEIIRMLSLHSTHNLDNMDRLHSSLDHQGSLNSNREWVSSASYVIDLDTSLETVW